MTPPTYIYCRTYVERIEGKNKPRQYFVPIYHHYIGITTNMKRRMKEHEKGLCRTTNRYNKSYKHISTRYKEIKDLRYEQVFKKYSTYKKTELILTWMRWVG